MDKAVITADIVHSRELSEKDRSWLLRELKRELKQIDIDFETKSEIYRGDSIQILVHDVKHALRVALRLKTCIKGLNPSEKAELYKAETLISKRLIPVWILDIRVAIGIGDVGFVGKNIITSDGEAFQISGLLLDRIKNSNQTMAIESADENNAALKVESMMLDAILSRSTALQAQVLYFKLRHFTEVVIAKTLKINQSAVNQRSTKGSWNVISEYLNYFEAMYDR